MSQNALIQRLAPLADLDDLPADAKAALAALLTAPASGRDSRILYIIVGSALGLTAIATVIGGIYLAAVGRGDAAIKLPDAIVAIGSAAAGALAGLLAPAPK